VVVGLYLSELIRGWRAQKGDGDEAGGGAERVNRERNDDQGETVGRDQ
jgi:hypothetical protein